MYIPSTKRNKPNEGRFYQHLQPLRDDRAERLPQPLLSKIDIHPGRFEDGSEGHIDGRYPFGQGRGIDDLFFGQGASREDELDELGVKMEKTKERMLSDGAAPPKASTDGATPKSGSTSDRKAPRSKKPARKASRR